MVGATIRQVYRRLPSGLREQARSLRAAYYERRSRRSRRALFGAQAYYVPPIELMHDGPQDYQLFKQNGEEFLEIVTDRCALQPNQRVLDVGSGMGRKTLPLINYLDANGSYEGLDIVKAAISWCSARYTAQHPNFRFTWMNVWNGMYNQSGTIHASEYRLPFADQEFDLVILGSVFTHMLPADMRQYMSEIARVLKPGGRSTISYFLLNAESERCIAEGRSTLPITHEVAPGCKVLSAAIPERAVAYDQNDILQLYAQYDLKATLSYGSWCGRTTYQSYQDMIIGEKI